MDSLDDLLNGDRHKTLDGDDPFVTHRKHDLVDIWARIMAGFMCVVITLCVLLGGFWLLRAMVEAAL